jgi:hypothetical protein
MNKIKSASNYISLFLISFLPFFYIFSIGALNVSFAILSIFFLLFFFFSKKNFLFSDNKILIFICIFWLYLIITSIAIHKDLQVFLRSLFFGRYLIFILFLDFIFRNNKFFFEKIKLFNLTLILFVILDIWFQYFAGVDLLGYSTSDIVLKGRLSGPFGKELIPGSYLFFIGITSLLFFFLNKKLDIKFYLILFVLLITIFITGERTNILNVFFFLFFLTIFSNKNKNFFLIMLISSIIFFFTLINLSKDYSWRMKGQLWSITNPQVGFADSSIQELQTKDIIDKNYTILQTYVHSIKEFKNTQWGAHWLTAYAIFNDNFFFGSGIRSFRTNCHKYDNIDSLRKDYRCSTHPHNALLEILSETGIFGFAIIFFLLLSLLKTTCKINNFYTTSIFILIILIVFPLKPSGAFFSSWYGSIFWYLLGYYYCILNFVNHRV